MADKISVLLVDDHALVRRGFRRLLEDESDIVVQGEASDGEEAVQLAKTLRPNVVVMDCALPGVNGLAATRRILEENKNVAVLMLSMHSENTWVRQAFDAGARGYVLKNAVDLELVTAIRRVAAGEVVLDPQIDRLATLKGERETGLTSRELEILQLIVDGKSNKEIASQLNLSANTVAVHRANIMDALGIHKTAELVVFAIRNGLVNVPLKLPRPSQRRARTGHRQANNRPQGGTQKIRREPEAPSCEIACSLRCLEEQMQPELQLTHCRSKQDVLNLATIAAVAPGHKRHAASPAALVVGSSPRQRG